jgi:hypothetical protein
LCSAKSLEQLMPPKTPDRPIYLEPRSVFAVMLYCGILVSVFMYFLGWTPDNHVFARKAAEASDQLDVPQKLATEETTGHQ